MHRRAFCQYLGAASLLATLPLKASPALVGAGESSAIQAIERKHGGRLGVYVYDFERRRELSYRSNERFKLLSTFKELLAAFVLSEAVTGRLDRHAYLPLSANDLLPASPITTAHVNEGKMTIEALCEAIMYRSDNAAANILMRHLGGPEALTRYLRQNGDSVTRVDNYEGQTENKPDAFDSTTPEAMVRTSYRLNFGAETPAPSRDQLQRWMEGNVVGKSRLRSRFPDALRSGDRTGTADGWCNDVAFAIQRSGQPLLAAVYYYAEKMELPAQEAVLREVADIIVRWGNLH